jgi:hypothetical protein
MTHQEARARVEQVAQRIADIEDGCDGVVILNAEDAASLRLLLTPPTCATLRLAAS